MKGKPLELKQSTNPQVGGSNPSGRALLLPDIKNLSNHFEYANKIRKQPSFLRSVFKRKILISRF